ncbi:MAG: DUF4395 domain-containing protein [Acidimicrobiales bacterium]
MTARLREVFSFPDEINEIAARIVAGCVVAMCIAAIATQQPLVLVALAYGFWARFLSGPSLSPLGALASRVVAPRIAEAKIVPGPPKRFAQGMGVAFSTLAIIFWYGFGWHAAAWVTVGMLSGAAFLEATFALCLGCKIFGLLMKAGVIPEAACVECANIALRHSVD